MEAKDKQLKQGYMGCAGLSIYWTLWLVVMCFYFYFNNIDAYRDSVKVKGKVVDVLAGKVYKRYYSHPQVEFHYHDSTYLFTHMKRLTGGAGTGDEVTVIFPRNDPDNAEIYVFFGYWLSLKTIFISFLIGGILFLIPALIEASNYSYLQKQKAKNNFP